jgi:hypothetical protein
MPERITPPVHTLYQVNRNLNFDRSLNLPNGQSTGLHQENTRPSYTESQVNELKHRLSVDCDGKHHESCLADLKEAYKVAVSKFGADSASAMWLANAVKTAEAQDRAREQAKQMREADEFCVQANLQYGSAGQGLCDAAMDRAVGQVSGKPSAYDLCHAGSGAACEIAMGHMSVSDPRYDEVWSRIHRPYEFH